MKNIAKWMSERGSLIRRAIKTTLKKTLQENVAQQVSKRNNDILAWQDESSGPLGNANQTTFVEILRGD